MKKIIILMLFCSPIIAFAQKTNFTGKYKIVKEKVNFGDAPEWIIPRYITVDQEKDQIYISKVYLNQQLEEQPAKTDTLNFDGLTKTRTGKNGQQYTQSLKWLNDQSFIVDYNISGNEIHETYFLEDSNKTLRIERAVKQTNGMEYTTHCYFERQ